MTVQPTFRHLSLPGRPSPYVMAHRGNRHRRPENTLAAFRLAFEEGADLLETDLHLSRDGEFVCIHDDTLDRTTTGSGRVSDHSLAELKRFSAGKGFPAFSAERIPTLAETLALIPADRAVGLEFKTPRLSEPAILETLVQMLFSYHLEKRCLLLSFSVEPLKTALYVAPGIPVGLISLERLKPPSWAHFAGPFWPLLFLNPLFTAMARRRGQLVCPLDPLPDPRLRWYLALGCDAVLSDNPGQTITALQRLGAR